MRAGLSIELVVAGCGRIGFEARSYARGVDAPGDAPPDAVDPACLISDGICVFGCAGIDDDCTTTCGDGTCVDGTCVGNAGELCANCAMACMTTNAVCGNGACDPGEPGAGCYADCGPSPWPWTQEEADLLGMLNATVRRATPARWAPSLPPPP